jgi:predicted GNAT family N-acyltransferase
VPNIIVQKIQNEQELELAHQIRYEVFVIGQKVPEREEIDENEKVSSHFLAYAGDVPCGAARWRFTDNGVKLERFAVLEKYRGQGVGSALVAAVLADVEKDNTTKGKLLYLHAQLSAMPLYSKFGFRPEGPMFQECAIDHYKMVF